MTDNKSRNSKIPLMVPDMPSARELLPWLERIDQARWYTNRGPLVNEFESSLQKIVKEKRLGFEQDSVHIATTCSGTAALELALVASGIGEGKKVMLPALTFPATATAVCRAGAQPVFVDVDPYRWTLSPEIARDALKHAHVDLVLPVAAFGSPLPTAEWDRFKEKTGVPVLIDAAAALFNQVIGRDSVTVFSLHATKPFGVGEGGLVAAADIDLIEVVKRLANFGIGGSEGVVSPGQNAKMSEYHAAVGMAQIGRIEKLLKRRHQVWQIYRSRIDQMSSYVRLQRSSGEFIRPCLPIRLMDIPDLSEVVDLLATHHVETRRWYHPPLNAHPGFDGYRTIGPDGRPNLPITSRLNDQLLGIPFHSHLSEFEIARICSLVGQSVEQVRKRDASVAC